MKNWPGFGVVLVAGVCAAVLLGIVIAKWHASVSEGIANLNRNAQSAPPPAAPPAPPRLQPYTHPGRN